MWPAKSSEVTGGKKKESTDKNRFSRKEKVVVWIYNKILFDKTLIAAKLTLEWKFISKILKDFNKNIYMFLQGFQTGDWRDC